jgi:hypothetical protein
MSNDLAPSRAKYRPPIARITLVLLLIAAATIGIRRLTADPPRFEVSATRSPDGTVYAVLTAVPKDAGGSHSYIVSLRRSPTGDPTKYSGREVAYLSGVPWRGIAPNVALVWPNATELEIRYTEAIRVDVYWPVFTWAYTSSRRSSILSTPGNAAPIFIKAVRMEVAKTPP